LNYENVLIDPERKEVLQRRIDYLARNTLLIPSRYAITTKQNRIWVYRHFNEIANHIREREKWIISPASNTLLDLRRDFADFALLYTNGLYGNVKWDNNEKRQPSLGIFNILSKSLRFLFKILGFAIPLIFVFLYLSDPLLLSPIKIDLGILNLIFVSWTLIAIDSIFNLGVVAQVTKTAKEIKDLS
jgi:hypothetical protein